MARPLKSGEGRSSGLLTLLAAALVGLLSATSAGAERAALTLPDPTEASNADEMSYWRGDMIGRPSAAGILPSPGDDDESAADAESEASDEDEAQSDIAARLDALEEKYGELEDDYTALKDSMKNVATSGHEGATMKVSGRIHADHWAFSGDSPGVNAFESGDPTISPQDRIGFRRLRFGVGGDVWKTMLYRIEIEFAGGNNTEFRDAYLGWRDVPLLQTVHVGNQKRPYGLDHLNSSRFNVFMERPFIIEAFNQDSRRLGIASYGVSADERWNWRYGVFNQRLVQDEGVFISDHYQAEFAGRLAQTWWYDECSGGRGYGHWAISGTHARPDGSNIPGRAENEARFRTRPEARSTARWLDTRAIDGADHYQLLGLESVVNLGALQLVAEYQHIWLDRDLGFGPGLEFHGGYVYLSYFLTGEHIPWDRRRGVLGRVEPLENFFLVDTCCQGIQAGWGAWQVAVRGSYADLTDDDVLGGIGESVTFGLNWHWNPYARMQFNYIYGNIHDHAPVAGLTFGDYHILGTRFMVDF